MIKRKMFVFIFSMLTIFSLVGQISAGFSSLSIINEFQNGIVDIEINEEKPNTSSPQMVMPFDEICKNQSITNNGADCYIRAKLIFSNQDIGNNAIISGIGDDWVLKNDGYYYYIKTLQNGDTVDVFKSIRLGDIDDEYQMSNFDVELSVDAVQNKNFVVDFDSENPWGEVEIVNVDKTSNIKEYKPTPDETFKIIYQDDIKGMVNNFERFFCDAKILMPGDYCEDTLEIKNNTNSNQTIYFATANTLNKVFLDKVIFEITNENGDLIYKGSLGEDRQLTLATLNPKTSCNIKFKIEIPKEITNEFVLQESSVKWTFSTKNIADSPQTGDNSHIEIYALLMLGSVIGLILSIKGIKKHD